MRPQRSVGASGRPLNFIVRRATGVSARLGAAVLPTTFRKLALSFPASYESSHMRHPDFRVGRKVFATLAYPDVRWGTIKLTPKRQALFVRFRPDVFTPVKGRWGIRGATNIRLRAANTEALRPALELAWKND